MDYSNRLPIPAAFVLFVFLALTAAACSATEISTQARPEPLGASSDVISGAGNGGEAADSESAASETEGDAAAATDVSASSDDLQDECPLEEGASTSSVLWSLAPDLRDSSAAGLATEAEELASAFEAPEPSSAALVSLITLLPQVSEALASSDGVPCWEILQSALGRLGITSSEAGAAVTNTAAEDDVASVLSRAYDLSVDDADCVANELVDVAADQINDLAVLVALSACANGL